MKHLNVLWLWIKETHKRFWAYWFSYTEADEKVIAALQETEKRYKKTVEEVKDVVDAVKGK